MADSFIKSLRYRLLPRTLFGRSLMIIALPILLLQVVVAFMFFDRHWDSMTEKLISALSGEIEVLSTQLAQAPQPARIIAQASKNLEMVITIEPLDKAALKPGQAFDRLIYFSIGEKLREGLQRKVTRPFAIQTPRERWFDIVVKLDNKRMARFQCPERRLASSTTYIFILWVIGSAMVLLGIAMLFMRNQIRPIMRLAVAAEKFGKGQDVPDFRPVGAREVRQASTAFLEMRDRLKRQMEQRTAMLSGVSHDLRTPLTRMKLQLAMTKSGAGAENLRQDIEEMEKMIEGYLTFAKGESDEQAEMTDLKTVLERLVGKAKRQGANIQEQLPEARLMIKVRPIAIERAISNIITNASKFAKNAWLSAHEQSGTIEIIVDDDGPGITAELRDDVFKPFYRVEKSRNKKTGGVGLGLSIAQDIVHSHGGEIFLEDSNRGGLRVVIRLPV